MQSRIKQLIQVAEERMKGSNDSTHDECHVARVVAYAKQISATHVLNSKQRQALILAAWWHDTGRTILKHPSVWMRCVDDALSAFLLWKEAIKVKEFSSIISIAIRVILCKNIGFGKIFTRIILPRHHRTVLHILQDADTLDVVSIERMQNLCLLVKTSSVSERQYKLAVWWFVNTREFQFRTQKARENFVELMQDFLLWLQEQNIFEWHRKTFGHSWIQKQIKSAETILENTKRLVGV